MIYSVKLLTSPEEVKRLYEFVKRFPLDYPDYAQWLEKCIRELEIGYKKTFYAANDDGEILGSVIFQKHKQDHRILEIKNLRVRPESAGAGIGSVLEALVEIYSRENGFSRIQADSHQDNPVVRFLKKRGYRIIGSEALYTAEKEAILCKDVSK